MKKPTFKILEFNIITISWIGYNGFDFSLFFIDTCNPNLFGSLFGLNITSEFVHLDLFFTTFRIIKSDGDKIDDAIKTRDTSLLSSFQKEIYDSIAFATDRIRAECNCMTKRWEVRPDGDRYCCNCGENKTKEIEKEHEQSKI